MTKFLFTLIFAILFGSLSAQKAPDFQLKDIKGNDHHLYDYLGDQKAVLIDFSATWCSYCWILHQTKFLEDMYQAFGPNGTDQLRVLYFECDPRTTLEQLEGKSGSTYGDWLSGSSYPFVDLNRDETYLLNTDHYDVKGYPSIKLISPIDSSSLELYGRGNASLKRASNILFDMVSPREGRDMTVAGLKTAKNSCGTVVGTFVAVNGSQGTFENPKFDLIVNGESTRTLTYEGTVTPNSLVSVDFADLKLDRPSNIIQVRLMDTDDKSANNITSTQVNLISTDNKITFSVATDDNTEKDASQISILDANGRVVYQSGVLPAKDDFFSEVTLSGTGCHTIVLQDGSGDGFGSAISIRDSKGVEIYNDRNWIQKLNIRFEVVGEKSESTVSSISFNSGALMIKYSEPVDPETVNDRSIVVYGSKTGKYNGSFDVDGNLVFFKPSSAFNVGESISVTSTSSILNFRFIPFENYVKVLSVPVRNASEAKFEKESASISLESDLTKYSYDMGVSDFNKDGMTDIYFRYHKSYGDSTYIVVYMAESLGKYREGVKYSDKNSHSGGISTPDVNGDGYPDIAFTHNLPSQTHVRINDGTGSFGKAQLYEVASFSDGGVYGDIDGDGDLDFVGCTGIASLSNNRISIRRNNGDGTFSKEENVTTGIFMYQPQLFDLDLDGDLDIILYSTTQFGSKDEIRIYRNNSNGQFDLAKKIDAEGKNVVSLVDFNNNGNLSLLTNDSNFELHNISNIENLSVSDGEILYPNTSGIILSDFNGDHLVDIVQYGFSKPDSLLTHIRDKDDFRSVASSALSQMLRIATADVDNDGDIDIIYLDENQQIGFAINGNGATTPNNKNELTLILNDVESATGTTAKVPISVKSFEDVLGYSFSISLGDTSTGKITGISTGKHEPQLINQVSDTEVLVSWNDPSGSTKGTNLPDSTVIFYVDVSLTGQSGACTGISFSESPLELSAVVNTSDGYETIQPKIINAEVCILNEVIKAGNIQTESGIAVQDVRVACNDTMQVVMTDAEGNYRFEPSIAGMDYTVSPTKDGNDRNGIRLLDVILIQQHYLENKLLDSPYKLIAADVNNDCKINVIDESMTRRVFGFVDTVFSEVNSWKFVPRAMILDSTATDCHVPYFEESVTLKSLSQDTLSINFVAVKSGDVTQDAIGTRSARHTDLIYKTVRYEGKEMIAVYPSDFAERSYGFQLSVAKEGYPVEIHTPNLSGEVITVDREDYLLLGWYHPQGSTIDMSKYNADRPLFYIEMSGAKPLTLSRNKSEQELYDENFERVHLGLRSADVLTEGLVVYQNVPNPFVEQTEIAFSISRDDDIRIEIYDALGRVVMSREETFSAGYHTISIDRTALTSNGSLLYRVSTGDASVSKLMTLIK